MSARPRRPSVADNLFRPLRLVGPIRFRRLRRHVPTAVVQAAVQAVGSTTAEYRKYAVKTAKEPYWPQSKRKTTAAFRRTRRTAREQHLWESGIITPVPSDAGYVISEPADRCRRLQILFIVHLCVMRPRRWGRFRPSGFLQQYLGKPARSDRCHVYARRRLLEWAFSK